MDKKHHVRISSTEGFSWKLGEVWTYRDLILLLTKKYYTVRYKQTILGPVWSFLYPLFSSAVMTVVFHGIAGIETEGVPALLFYFFSNSVWGFFSSCVRSNSFTFTANAYLFGKVYFPRLCVPFSSMLISLTEFMIQMCLFIPMFAYYIFKGILSPNWPWIFLIPVFLLQLGLMAIGFGVLFSSFTTKYRDLSVLIDVGIRSWMYLTPVIYPASEVGIPIVRELMFFNPVTFPMEAMRLILFGNGTVNLLSAVVSVAATAGLFSLGVVVFNKVERTFMDTV